MKAFGYIRVSGKGQIEGDGFRRQEAEIEAYAKAHKIEIVNVYREEGISGTADEAHRPAFQAMVEAILRNGVRTIIVEGLDRLAREYRIQETLLVYLASKGIELIAARTGENVTEAVLADPMRKALVQIQGVFAELEKGLLVKKLRVAREQKRDVTGKCEGRKSVSEAAPEVLAEVRRLRRTKPGQKQMSYAKIAERFNTEGRLNLNGKAFTATGIQMMIFRLKAK